MSDLVLCEKHDGVALLTLNRPCQLNALNCALIDRMMALLDLVEDDPDTKAVVLTGAGEKAFSAGADIKEFSQAIEQGPDIALKLFVKRGQAMTARLEAFPKPVIAAVNGLAFGGGCEITEAVHLAIASETPPSRSLKSASAFRPHLAEPSAYRALPAESAHSSIF